MSETALKSITWIFRLIYIVFAAALTHFFFSRRAFNKQMEQSWSSLKSNEETIKRQEARLVKRAAKTKADDPVVVDFNDALDRSFGRH
jgi:hypothetical protein